MNKRKFEISYINILLCLGVIAIHVLSEPINMLERTSASFVLSFIPWRMLTCAVPGFIFLSGLKLSLKPVKNWGKFYWRRFTSVIVAYLIWMPVYYFFSYKLGYYESVGLKHFFTVLFDGTSTAHFYFIVVIVQFYLLHPLWQALTRLPAIPVLVIAFFVTAYSQIWLPVVFDNNGIVPFLTNDRLLTNYLLYYILGCYIGRNYDKFINTLHRFRILVYVPFICLAVTDLFFSYRVFAYREINLWIYYVNMAYCSFAILSLLAMCGAVAKKYSPSGFVVCLDKASYYIYLTHLLVLMIAKYVLDVVGVVGVLDRLPFIGAATYAIPVALCMGYVKLRSSR
jgi:membrane-bound acyltransferase YfiQ involved in biofilm formation